MDVQADAQEELEEKVSKGKLTLRQKRFVYYFCGKANGIASHAAILAGYARDSAKQTAYRLMRLKPVKDAIKRKSLDIEDVRVATALELDGKLTEIIDLMDSGHTEQARVAITAVSELNRTMGRHLQKHEHQGAILHVVTGVPESEGQVIDGSSSPGAIEGENRENTNKNAISPPSGTELEG